VSSRREISASLFSRIELEVCNDGHSQISAISRFLFSLNQLRLPYALDEYIGTLVFSGTFFTQIVAVRSIGLQVSISKNSSALLYGAEMEPAGQQMWRTGAERESAGRAQNRGRADGAEGGEQGERSRAVCCEGRGKVKNMVSYVI